MQDVTEKYKDMIEGFELDFTLAAESIGTNHGYELDGLQEKLEQGDERLLADVELLKEFSFGLRHGKLRIMQSEKEVGK